MTGIYYHTIDAKGRLFIPARLREELGDVFYVTLSMDKCLSAFSSESWAVFTDKINAMPMARQRRFRPVLSHALKCVLDGQGRALLTQTLRTFAGLDKRVTIVGVGERAEFWDSDAFEVVDAQETTPEYIANVFEELEV